MAEANRPDGFVVLSLGYITEPPMSFATLFGNSDGALVLTSFYFSSSHHHPLVGLDTMLEDIWVTEDEVGMRHYLTSPAVNLANAFVRSHTNSVNFDTIPPHWSSTYNPNPFPPQQPPARVGLQVRDEL